MLGIMSKWVRTTVYSETMDKLTRALNALSHGKNEQALEFLNQAEVRYDHAKVLLSFMKEEPK